MQSHRQYLWCRSTSPYAVAVLIDYVPGQEHGPHLIQYLPIMPDIAPILTLVTGIMLIAITKISKPITS
ncbi:MAG: hypothetical protein NDF55_03930 [archaeon GB-1867-005]|nr:hypothetical protein [Candidatus Culexmicrobium cathedralense]